MHPEDMKTAFWAVVFVAWIVIACVWGGPFNMVGDDGGPAVVSPCPSNYTLVGKECLHD